MSLETPVASAPTAQLSQLVDRYVQLRDRKTELKTEYEKSVEQIDAAMTRIENFLLKHLNDSGSESVRTEAGTFFKSERTSATVADWDAALNFIRDNEHWAMLDKRVSKAFVVAYKEEHNDLPPGINWRSEVTVNVRRA